MHFNLSGSSNWSALSLFCSVILLTSACNDDDGLALFQDYDPVKHVYATSQDLRNDAKEAIVNPATGAFYLMEGTSVAMAGIALPIGPRFLTDFVNNRRIYPRAGLGEIVIQDLETLESTSFDITAHQSWVSSWDFLTFGPDNNTIFGYDLADSRVFALDIPSQSISVIAEGLPNFGLLLEKFDYLPSSNELIFFTQNSYLIYDLTNQIISAENTLSKDLFGFVKHPVTENIYAISLPTDERGVRLVELVRTENNLEIRELSVTDLPISNLSPNLQTIHTASNTYICRGGSTSLDNPESFLYSIDLSNGRLLYDVQLEGFGLMLKLRGG